MSQLNISTIQLSEEQFWRRYFQSKLFNTHRASIRSSATQHVVKADPIFDKYLEKDDDGQLCLVNPDSTAQHFFHPQELEPRRQRSDPVELFVNLGATLEDHGEVILTSQLDVLCLIYPSYRLETKRM